jgi:ankyrin repeat protein
LGFGIEGLNDCFSQTPAMSLRTLAPLAACFIATSVWSAPALQTSPDYQALLHAIIQNDAPTAKRLLDQGLDPNACVHSEAENAILVDADRPPDQPLLVVAARFGSPDSLIVAALLDHKATVDARDAKGRTPLMYAAQLGWSPSVTRLLQAKADVNAADAQGKTVLMHALGNRTLSTIATLLERGAKINATDAQGMTPLMYAVRDCRHDPLRIYGRKDDPAAATARYLELSRYLIDHQADVNHRDRSGQTALGLARSGGGAEMVELLKKAGATE